MRVSALFTALTTFVLFEGVFADSHSQPVWKKANRRHHDYKSRHVPPTAVGGGGGEGYGVSHPHPVAVGGNGSDVQVHSGRDIQIERRFDNGRFSFYDAGLGACGATNTGADFVSGFM